MGWRTRVACFVAAVAVGVVLLSPGSSQASDSYPEQVQLSLQMQCAPPCTICHTSQEGGLNTAIKPFGIAIQQRGGLMSMQPERVRQALDAVQNAMPPIDSDRDGFGDVDELRAMHDPNVPAPDDVLICPPTYGCGARVAPRPPLDGSALAFALIVGGFLALRFGRSA